MAVDLTKGVERSSTGYQISPAMRRFGADVVLALMVVGGAAAARIGIEQVVGGVAPFVLTFPAVMMATLINGGRAGTMAAVGCQILTIRYVFPNWIATHSGVSTELANVVLSTVVLGAVVWAMASYRTMSGLVRLRSEDPVHMLTLLMSEMDHRTKNNFQIAAGLLAHQSVTSPDPQLTRELDKAAARLETIASLYESISINDETRRSVDLADHLERIVVSLRTGAAHDDIQLTYRADHAVVPVQSAIILGLIVNEWVTNALKHAFAGTSGHIAVEVAERWGTIELSVRDDGEGDAETRHPNRGSDLMTSLADVIGATITVTHGGGTRCSLTCDTIRGRSHPFD